MHQEKGLPARCMESSTTMKDDLSNRTGSGWKEEDGFLLRDTYAKNRSLASIPPPAEADNLRGDSEQAFGTDVQVEGNTCRKRQREIDVSMLGEDDQILEIKSSCFYKRSVFKAVVFALVSVVSGGLALIVCFSFPRVYARLRFKEVKQNDEEAELVLVESLDGIVTLTEIQRTFNNGGEGTWMPASKARGISVKLMSPERMFVWREERFWYNDEDGSWTRRDFNVDLTYAELHTIAHDTAVQESHESESRRKRYLAYGSNQLRVDMPSFGRLLITEVFKPFFIFQVFSIAIWMYQDYRIYAYVILSMTIVAVLFNVVQTRRNLQAVQKLASSDCQVKRLTLTTTGVDTEFKAVLVSSSELLPGDLVEIEAGMLFPCDLVLLAGQCVVNESMLTGESALVPKTPLPTGPSAYGQVFDTKSERDGRHMLLSGTTAVQIRGSSSDSRMHRTSDLESNNEHRSIWQFFRSRSSEVDLSPNKEDATQVAAMVITTGYGTAKGRLVRAIRFPKPSKYNFERKLYYFVANSGIYLIFVCAITIYFQVGKESASAIFLRCINLVTIAVPAALPLALSIGISVSFKRLQGNAVCCINPSRIVGAGRVDTLCFDKTGTITEDGLNLRGVVPVMECETQNCSNRMSCGQLEKDLHAVFLQGQKALLSSPERNSVDRTSVSSLGLFYTLAACHSVSVLDYKTGFGILKEDGIKNQSGWENAGKGWKRMWFQTFRKMCQVLRYNHFNFKRSQTSSEQERGDAHKISHFIGDPLEIQMFTSTGWRYLTYPFDEIFQSVQRPTLSTSWIDVVRAVDGVIIAPSDGNSNPLLAILRRFDFDSEIRLMSSIVLELPARDSSIDSARSWILVKGAPESLQEICVPESLPHNFTSQLEDLTHKGYRVLACAYRLLQSMTIPQMMAARRQEMEKELTYCGFLVMENKLKPETSGVLHQLAIAGLREVMVTGDNPYTAAAVARESGPFFLRPSCRTYLLDRAASSSPERYKSGCVLKDVDSDESIDVDDLLLPQLHVRNRATRITIERSSEIGGNVNLIVTGRAFAALTVQHDDLREQFTERTGANKFKVTECVTPFQMVLTQASIFSRMSPQHKMELMRSLQDLGYVVCMTGDGANDSGALKAADVGISISSKKVDSTDTMAAGPSIAAPFSTKLAHIGVVPMVLAEGRCALVSATVMFKYMYFYALIQATSVLVLYRLQLELYDYQYLWADLGLVFPLVLLMPATRPRELTRGRPEDNPLALPILISVYGQSVLIMVFQVLAQLYLEKQSWYEKPNTVNSEIFSAQHNYNSTVSFLFASFQYMSLAMTLSQSFGMFRNSLFTNIPLMATLIFDFVLSSIMLLKPDLFTSAFSVVHLSNHRSFLFRLWALAIGNSLLFILFERFAVKHKSTERDISDPHQDNFCRIRRTEKRDYFKVIDVAGPAWAGLPKKSKGLLPRGNIE